MRHCGGMLKQRPLGELQYGCFPFGDAAKFEPMGKPCKPLWSYFATKALQDFECWRKHVFVAGFPGGLAK